MQACEGLRMMCVRCGKPGSGYFRCEKEFAFEFLGVWWVKYNFKRSK
jgi:hypothetical protein